MPNRDVKKSKEKNLARWELGGWAVSETARSSYVLQEKLDIGHWMGVSAIHTAADCHDLIRVLQEAHCDMMRREAMDSQRAQGAAFDYPGSAVDD